MTLVRDSGVVLRTYRLGEADRIVVLLSEAHGKVRAVGKGARRTASKLGARVEPLSHISVLWWQGRSELAVINQAESLDHFRAVREDLERMSSGLSMLEVADQLAQEGNPDPGLYRMLVGALRTLAGPPEGVGDPAPIAPLAPLLSRDGGPGVADMRGASLPDPKLLAAAFFWKALAHEGASPVLDACASCAEPADAVELVAFDLTEGGALCRSCRRGRPVSPGALDMVRRILGGSLGAVLAGPRPPCTDEVVALATEAMEAHIDRRLRSVRASATLTW